MHQQVLTYISSNFHVFITKQLYKITLLLPELKGKYFKIVTFVHGCSLSPSSTLLNASLLTQQTEHVIILLKTSHSFNLKNKI